MSKKVKAPKPYVPPKLWRFYTLAGYGRVLLPFKPNHLEFFWARNDAPWPLSEHLGLKLANLVAVYGEGAITKSRGWEDYAPDTQYVDEEIARILAYAAIRDQQPLRQPPTMDFSHFV